MPTARRRLRLPSPVARSSLPGRAPLRSRAALVRGPRVGPRASACTRRRPPLPRGRAGVARENRRPRTSANPAHPVAPRCSRWRIRHASPTGASSLCWSLPAPTMPLWRSCSVLTRISGAPCPRWVRWRLTTRHCPRTGLRKTPARPRPCLDQRLSGEPERPKEDHAPRATKCISRRAGACDHGPQCDVPAPHADVQALLRQRRKLAICWSPLPDRDSRAADRIARTSSLLRSGQREQLKRSAKASAATTLDRTPMQHTTFVRSVTLCDSLVVGTLGSRVPDLSNQRPNESVWEAFDELATAR